MKSKMIFGGLLGGTAIILGAIGSHALKHSPEPSILNGYHTAIRYLMFHSLFFLIIPIIEKSWNIRLNIPALVTGAGILLFAGSIVLLALIPGILPAVITPIGGVLMIAGWFAFVVYIARIPIN